MNLRQSAAFACLACLVSAVAIGQTLPAFPGAEGFGAIATGGRGGAVFEVTTLDPDPAGVRPGSLNHALRQPGPRTIVFRVSGVIHGIANVVHGDVTIAGQSSPGGIIVRGLVCDGHYERNHCDNLIVRHLRIRPGWNLPLPAGGERLDDALRLDGVHAVMVDHVTLAHAADEALQISWASDVTIQDSMLGETVGAHAERGGVLLNYSHPEHPQDRIALIRNLWFRVGGRTPEISCEASNYEGQSGQIASCQQTPLNLELANNLYVDPGFVLWYNRDVDQNAAAGPYVVRLNAVGNRYVVRGGFAYGMFLSDLLAVSANQLYLSDNRMSIYPNYADYQLFYCCNDYPANAPNTDTGSAQRRSLRHPYPTVSYRAGDTLAATLPAAAGALPHDPLERRWQSAAQAGLPVAADYGTPQADDTFDLDFAASAPPAAPADSDHDGVPDSFELAQGLNPADPTDRNGTGLSLACTGASGYTNLECWLHQRAQGSAQSAGPIPISGAQSGSWYDPARNGEGLLLEVGRTGTQRTLVASWYTYRDGRQMWLVGSAPLAEGASSVSVPMVVTRGASFGLAFRPGDVVAEAWGTLQLRFPSCGQLTMDYAQSGGESGTLTMQRILDGIDGLRCP